MISVLPPRAAAILLAALLPVAAFAVPPTIDAFVIGGATPADIAAGKTLVVPVAVTNPDGNPLSFSVTSSNPNIIARVKTGNPVLRLRVKYEGSSPFEGDLDLQLFRELAPVTVGHISGLAQAGYYDNQIFHRVIKDFVVQGGDPAGNGTGVITNGQNQQQFVGLPFNFEHEFQPSLVFSGIGQLAMANSSGGYSRGITIRENSQVPSAQIALGDFSATNGSQFFITTSTQRGNLDFKHTIFGQLVRGFALLDQINNVPVTNTKPTTDVKLVSARILPGTSEATVLLGARAVGPATITVTVEDSLGNKATRSFPATGKPDLVNTRPVLRPFKNGYASLGEFPSLFLDSLDLEGDRSSFGIAAVRPSLSSTDFDFLPNFIGFAGIARSYGTIGTPGVQTFAVGVSDYLNESSSAVPFADSTFGEGEFAPFASFVWQVQRYIIGKKPVRMEGTRVEATSTTAGTFVVARFSDTDPTATPTTHAAIINWGDGTAPTAGTVARDTSRPGSALFTISGSHTYAQPGIYRATATLTWNVPGLGQNEAAPEIESVGSPVFVTPAAATLRAQGQALNVSSARGTLANRIVATFTDTNTAKQARDYVATVDWGDGAITSGVVTRTAPGRFAVRGTHTYRDAETFALIVRIRPQGAPDNSGDAITWSTVTMSGFTPAPHAPPFPIVSLRAAWRFNSQSSEGISKVVTGGLVSPYNPANLTVQLRGVLEVANSGTRRSAASSVRAWLSKDATLNPTGTDADIPVPINGNRQITVGVLAPGAIVNTGDASPWFVNLPRGESGGGKFLLTEAVFSDPIVDANAVRKFSALRLPARVFVFDASANPAVTTQDGTTTRFTVRVVLDTKPTANVTIPVSSSNTGQGTVSAPTLTFTPDNFNVPQTVTVTGVNDNNANAVTYNLVIGTSQSTDTVLNGLTGVTIQITNRP